METLAGSAACSGCVFGIGGCGLVCRSRHRRWARLDSAHAAISAALGSTLHPSDWATHGSRADQRPLELVAASNAAGSSEKRQLKSNAA